MKGKRTRRDRSTIAVSIHDDCSIGKVGVVSAAAGAASMPAGPNVIESLSSAAIGDVVSGLARTGTLFFSFQRRARVVVILIRRDAGEQHSKKGVFGTGGRMIGRRLLKCVRVTTLM